MSRESRGQAEWPPIDDQQVLEARGPKNSVDAWQPYHFLVEHEVSRLRRFESVATLFLTNRECPLRCTMCDLWQNTLDDTVPLGAIPAQIDFALQRLPAAQHIKLYNSGNFFDPRAIPPEDYPAILERLDAFETLIVENHPRFCKQRCFDFQAQCGGRLEVAMGLETAHPQVLAALNKQMTLADFDHAVERLRHHDITVRAFVLLQPPFLAADVSVEWCLRTVHHAFEQGVDCCSVIPTRAGNGMMERLATAGHFQPPSLSQLEQVAEQALSWNAGRVFIDLWDADRFATCQACRPARLERLQKMNDSQQVQPAIRCQSCER